LDNTIKSPDETEAKLGTPVLGTIQLFRDEGAVEKVILEKPKSVIVEGYKALRTAILLSTSDKPPKNILITSVEPAEGKTATALNLAMTIAQSEYSVLLVDADLRKSVIHKQLDLDNSKGLSTVLAGASDDDVIFKGPIDNLHIIPSGPIPPNPSELLGSRKMIELVKMMNEKFDIIIWDSAPLLAVSDSHILSNIVDGTIIIARAGRTTYDAVRNGLKILYDLKSHILGIVINAVDARKSGYYYNKYYNYSYSSDEETEK
jgi:capsular exopolysaccharide synthesis family protein